MLDQMTSSHAQGTAIRPFVVDVPEADLDDLHRRLAATRLPSRELVADASQGVQVAMLQALVRYWANDHDWRKAEAKLNALPQFVTAIDGLDIHFIHVRSRHANALPLIVTHGWPGSVVEMLGAVGPLTDPAAHGGTTEDAFDLVLPSLPGYGFSGQPTEVGWDAGRTARAWAAPTAGTSSGTSAKRTHCARVGGADASSWVQPLRRPGRRHRRRRHRCDGAIGSRWPARHPPQLPADGLA